jgi:CRISPR/Cas system-associated exonuclease Cas4 (RecB family)
MTKQIAWSHSALSQFETCPRQFYLVRVAKLVKEPPSEATTWGNEVHKALEYRVRDKTPLPEGMAQWEPLAARFDGLKNVKTETQYALTRNLEPTGWFAKDVWVRAIIDVSAIQPHRGFAGDWKTGKVKADSDQLRLTAGVLMQHHKELPVVDTAFIWLKDFKVSKKSFYRDELPVIWEEYARRAGRIQAAADKNVWLPKPSGLCRGWCPATRAHCEFWEPKRK